MWVLPTKGRAKLCQRALDSIIAAETSTPGVVIVNGDEDPRYRDLRLPDGWTVRFLSENVGFLSALNLAFSEFCPGEPWYGLLNDDFIVHERQVEWDLRLIDAAGSLGFSSSNDGWQAGQSRMCGAIVFGGDLLRAMGWWCPPGLWHCYADDCWERLAGIFKNWTYVEDVLVEHKHVLRSGDPKSVDETQNLAYGANYEKMAADKEVWQAFLDDGFADLCKRIAEAKGITLSFTDMSNFVVVICTPMNAPSENAFKHCRDATINSLVKISGLTVHIVEGENTSHVGKGREKCLWQAMRLGATHIFFVDSDMTWDHQDVQRLLASDHDVSCVVGVRKQEGLSLCCNFLPNPQRFHPVTKFIELMDVGFAFVMLKRSAVERMHEAYPELHYKNDKHDESALFLDMIDGPPEDRQRLSEDYAFCRRWRALGGEIWANPQSALGHIGRKVYTGKVADVLEDDKSIKPGATE